LRGLFETPWCIAKGTVGGDAVALTVPLHPPTGAKLPVWVRTFSPATDQQAIDLRCFCVPFIKPGAWALFCEERRR
jgi:hypothetical protein